MWVGGCATALAAWASGPSALASRGPWGRRRRGTSGPTRSRVRLWGRRSVHRSAKMAPRSRFRAFVYTVVLWAWVVSGLGIATVYTNGRIGPLRAVSGHSGTLLGCGAVAGRRGDAGVYTDRRKWPLRAVSGRLCTLLRHESRYELRRELRRVARAPQPPWRAGGAPSRWAPLPWSGRQTLREWRRREVGVFAEASTHTNPRGANSWASFPTIVLS